MQTGAARWLLTRAAIIWDPESGRPALAIPGDFGVLRSAAVSVNGGRIAPAPRSLSAPHRTQPRSQMPRREGSAASLRPADGSWMAAVTAYASSTWILCSPGRTSKASECSRPQRGQHQRLVGAGHRLGMRRIGPVRNWSMRQSCPRAARERRNRDHLAGRRWPPALGSYRRCDREIGRTRIAPGVGNRRDRPRLVRSDHVVAEVRRRPVTRGPVALDLRSSCSFIGVPVEAAVPPPPESAASSAGDSDEIHGQFECAATAFGLDLVRAFPDIVARYRPAVLPEQRADVEHAAAAAVHVGLVVAGELLHAVTEVEQRPKWPGPIWRPLAATTNLPPPLEQTGCPCCPRRGR